MATKTEDRQQTAAIPAQGEHLRTATRQGGELITIDYLVHERWGTPHIVAMWTATGEDLMAQYTCPPVWAYQAAAADMVQARDEHAEALATESFSPVLGAGSFRGTGLGWLV